MLETPTSHQRSLVIMAEGYAKTVALPSQGKVLIGRDTACDITIPDPSLSRRHAEFHLGETVTVTDLGSRNETAVAGLPLSPNTPTEIRAGQMLTMGSVSLIVQRQSATQSRRWVWDHGSFEQRIEEELSRAKALGHAFTLVRIQLKDGDISQSPLSELEEFDSVGLYAPGIYDALIIDTEARPAQSIVEALQQYDTDGPITIVSYPTNGKTTPTLLSLLAGTASQTEIATSTIFPTENTPRIEQQIVTDEQMRGLYELAARVAQSRISVLITGETGTGKEVLSQWIHQKSARTNQPLICINCAAIAPELLESELFGYEAGAFSGAETTKPGLIQLADTGTLFLDEVGDMPPDLQAKLLRVIEDGQVRRVGGLDWVPVDLRIISATHHDLDRMVSEGTFRSDLYFRLAGMELHIPPLRDRPSELTSLAEYFIRAVAKRENYPESPQLSQQALRWLQAYQWPGNIRELRNVIERAATLSRGGTIELEHLPTGKLDQNRANATPGQQVEFSSDQQVLRRLAQAEPKIDELDLKSRVAALERVSIEHALEESGGHKQRASQMLGVPRRTFGTRLREFGLSRKSLHSDDDD